MNAPASITPARELDWHGLFDARLIEQLHARCTEYLAQPYGTREDRQDAKDLLIVCQGYLDCPCGDCLEEIAAVLNPSPSFEPARYGLADVQRLNAVPAGAGA